MKTIRFRIESSIDTRAIDKMISKLEKLESVSKTIGRSQNTKNGFAGMASDLNKLGSAAEKAAQSITKFNSAATKMQGGLNKINSGVTKTSAATQKVGTTATTASAGMTKLGASATTTSTSIVKMGRVVSASSTGVTTLGTTAGTTATRVKMMGTVITTTTAGATKMGTTMGTAATGATRLSTAVSAGSRAASMFATGIKTVGTGLASAGKGFLSGAASAGRFTAALITGGGGMTTFVARLASLSAAMSRAGTIMASFAATISGKLASAFKGGITATKSFVNSSASIFATLRRSLDSTGNLFTRFSKTIQDSMTRAQRAVKEFYSAGWSMLTSGYMLQNFGNQVGRGLFGGLNDYMSYEQQVTKTAIAGSGEGPGGQKVPPNPEAVREIISNIQRGDTGRGIAPVYQFDATQLAEGLYYYASAIGQPLISEGPNRNIEELSGVLSSLMSVSAITGTGLETMTKGTMNIALQFGIDPRDKRNASAISNIAAQVGLLSNISTMEVPDIFETMKMVGPMAHILAGGPNGGAGAGLEDMFALAFLSSEMGSRGGQPGRGYAQGFTSILDPTQKMIDESSKWLDTGGTREGWDELFIDPTTGGLLGGIPGLIKTLQAVPITERLQMLSTLFTNNATRAFLTSVLAAPDALEQMSSIMSGGSPQEWLSNAILATNDTISGNFQNMKNAWFEVQASIIDSISGPLKSAFKTFADILWNIGDLIRANPWIGEMIAGIGTIVAVIASAIGTFLMLGGTILLIMQAFARLGAVASPIAAIFFGIVRSMLVMVPLFSMLALAAGLLYGAWTTDFLGMRTAITGFFDSFDAGTDLVPFLTKIGMALRAVGLAFQDFFQGIVFGQGDLNNLGSFFTSLFGPLLGGALFGQLARLGGFFDDLRGRLEGFADGAKRISISMTDVGLSIQGFLEQMFMGMQRLETVAAMNRLGDALGIDNLSVKLDAFASRARTALSRVASAVVTFAGMMRDRFSSIGDNLQEIFTVNNLLTALRTLGSFATGVITGIASVLYGATTAVDLFTEGLTRLGDAGRWVSDLTDRMLGFKLSLNGIAQAFGVAFGVMIGGRMLSFLSPLVGLFGAIVPLIGKMALGFAQAAITAAGFVAQAILVAGALAAQAVGWIINTAELFQYNAGLAVETAQTILASGATTLFTATLSVLALIIGNVAAGLFVLVAAFAAIIAVLSSVAIIMVAVEIATHGLSAGFAAVMDIIAGIWQGIQPLVEVFTVLVGVIYKVGTALAGLIGGGNSFYNIGLMIGAAITGLTVSFGLLAIAATAAGVAIAISMFPALAPILAIIAVIGLFAAAYTIALAQTRDFGDAFLLIFSWIAEGVYKAMDQITNKLIIEPLALTAEAIDQMFGKLGVDTDFSSDIINNPMANAFANLDSLVDDYQAELRASGTAMGESLTSGFSEAIMNSPLGDTWSKVLTKAGLDPNNPDWGKFDLSSLFGMNEMDGFLDEFEASGMRLDPIIEEYFEASRKWEEWTALQEKWGSQAESIWHLQHGLEPIPTDPGALGEYYQQAAEATEEGAQALIGSMEEANASILDIMSNMSMEDMVSKTFDIATGEKGGKSVASALIEFGDDIIGNIGDAGPWMNMTELLADAAGAHTLDTNILGQNLHEALRPALEIVSQQTGIAIDDLMSDIPMYWAPEELMATATTDLLQGLSTIPTNVYEQFDTFGIAEGWTQFGLDWTSVATYAAGKAAQNMDWDFADYMAESYGIERDEAVQYLLDHGIPVDMISDEWFQDTEALSLAMGGQITVLDQPMYELAEHLAEGANGMAISITESDLATLPDAVKLMLDDLGYVFVLDDTAADINAWAGGVSKAIIAAAAAGQQAADWVTGTNSAPVVDNEGNPTGGQVGPTDEGWNARKKAVQEKYGTTPAPAQPRNIFSPPVVDVAAWETAAREGPEAAQAVISTLELDFSSFTTKTTEQATQAANGFIKSFTDALGGGKLQSAIVAALFTGGGGGLAGGVGSGGVSVNNGPFDAMFRNYATSAVKAFGDEIKTQMATALGQFTINATGSEGGGAASLGSGPFDAMFRNYAISAGKAFGDQLNTSIAQAMAGIGTPSLDNTASGGGSSSFSDMKIQVTADVTQATQALEDLRMKASYMSTGSWPVTVSIKFENLENYNTFGSGIQELVRAPWDVTINLGTADQVTEVQNVQDKLDSLIYASPYTVTVTALVTSALDAIESVLGKLRAMTTGSWNATVRVNDYASGTLRGVISLLNSISGRTVTSTANVVTNQTTVRKTLDMGTLKASKFAEGGVVRNKFQIVGEEGPELVSLPYGSLVHTASETERLMASVTASRNSAGHNQPVSSDVQAARSVMSIVADPQMRSSRHTTTQPQTVQPIQVMIENVNIAKEVDIDEALTRIDREIGAKMELSRRGMDTGDIFRE